jgi:hypothetical protein
LMDAVRPIRRLMMEVVPLGLGAVPAWLGLKAHERTGATAVRNTGRPSRATVEARRLTVDTLGGLRPGEHLAATKSGGRRPWELGGCRDVRSRRCGGEEGSEARGDAENSEIAMRRLHL